MSSGVCAALMAALATGSALSQEVGALQPAHDAMPSAAELRRFDESGTEFLPLAQALAPLRAVAEVFFATNRNGMPEADPEAFGNEVRAQTQFGQASLVSEGGVWRLTELEVEPVALPDLLVAPAAIAARAAAPEPATRLADLGLAPAQPMARFATAAAQPGADVLIYVHGAGHDFESALSTTARLAELYGRPGRSTVAMTFTYPTNGISDPLNYFRDRRDAGMSGFAMAEGFKRLTEFLAETSLRQPAGTVWLMSHSLGAYATRIAVQAIFEGGASPARVFDYVFLMGADDDYDTLSVEAKMRPILALTDDLVVYFADNDALLKLSVLANLRKPIGLDGPRNVDTADYVDTAVHAVNAEAFSTVNDPWRAHGYHTRSPRVVEDISALLGGLRPAQIRGRIQTGARSFRLVPE